MCLQTLEVVFVLMRKELRDGTNIIVKLLPGLVTSLLLLVLLHQDIAFSIVTSFAVLFSYRFAYLRIMKSLPLSFTLGEASIVTQGLVVFFFNCYLKLPLLDQPGHVNEQLTIILQIGLLAVVGIVAVARVLPVFRKSFGFYLLLLSVIVGTSIVPVGNKPSIEILLTFIFSDIERIAVIGVYVVLLGIAGVAVMWQASKNRKGTTAIRKIFHILIVMVYVPGLVFQCQFLYVASVVIFAVFIVLETARVIKLYPVAEVLEMSVEAFIDEKDPGKLALTPIYLLVGCSLPLWIHNSPCDLTGSASFELLPLISGVLSIGIGDTFASVVGSKFGRHKWPKSKKSVEGTIVSIVAQGMFIIALNSSGVVPLNSRLAAVCGIAVISNSLVEALTDQVDNLILPLITYICLTFK